ncbi:MAG TPA: transglycosylase domain-containing protein, partial [Steroidobacteraceae bacterium]|nr:transglycosylase domain-containing protein [Steroidobacteraceae bacterium]
MKKFLKKYWPHLLAIILVPILVFGLWVLQLDHQITTQFEGRRWTLPARVYAQPLELYAGQSLSVNELQTELQRLGYQPMQAVTRSGGFQRVSDKVHGDRINLVSRPFRFMDENRGEQVLTISFKDDHIDKLWDGKGQDVPIFRLDPLLIGSIFPIHGEDRIIVTPQDVPPLLPAALKIVEDRRFDSHLGVDPLGILRALWIDIRSGRFDQGG